MNAQNSIDHRYRRLSLLAQCLLLCIVFIIYVHYEIPHHMTQDCFAKTIYKTFFQSGTTERRERIYILKEKKTA